MILYGIGTVGCHWTLVWLGSRAGGDKDKLARALHADGLSGTPRSPSQKIWSPRNLLVVAPLAVSLMLLIGATVLVRGSAGRELRTGVRYLPRDRHVVPAKSPGL